MWKLKIAGVLVCCEEDGLSPYIYVSSSCPRARLDALRCESISRVALKLSMELSVKLSCYTTVVSCTSFRLKVPCMLSSRWHSV